MAKVEVDTARCKGCGLCVNVCPKKCLELTKALNGKGYHPAALVREGDCISCAMCAQMCPDVCLKVSKE